MIDCKKRKTCNKIVGNPYDWQNPCPCGDYEKEKVFEINKDCIYRLGTFKDSDNESTDEEKVNAIHAFTHMETINHVTKEQLQNALKWLYEFVFEEVIEC